MDLDDFIQSKFSKSKKQEFREQNIFDLTEESKEEIEKLNYDISKIHCNGCYNKCCINKPNCGRGKRIKDEILKYKT